MARALFNLAWIVSVLGELAVCCQIVRTGKVRTFFPLLSYFSADLIRSGILGTMSLFGFTNSSIEYSRVWMWTEPCMLIAVLAVAVSGYQRWLDCYPGVNGFRRKMLLGASMLSATIITAAVAPQILAQNVPAPVCYFALADEWAYLMASALLIITSVYFSIIVRLDARPSALRGYLVILTTYFGVKGLVQCVILLFVRSIELCLASYTVALLGSSVCYLAWLVALERPSVRSAGPMSVRDVRQARADFTAWRSLVLAIRARKTVRPAE